MVETVSCWSLIDQNRFEEALIKADEESVDSDSVFPLRNKIFGLLQLKKYSEAINLCNLIIEGTNGETDFDFIFLGVTYWLQGDSNKAVEVWRTGKETKYTDAAGGVEIPAILFFASVAIKDKILEKDSIKLLKKRFKSKRLINWPGPIAEYLLNKISEEELLNSVSKHQFISERQLCQALFYIAVNKLKECNYDAYRDYLKQTVSLGASSYLVQEYYLAESIKCCGFFIFYKIVYIFYLVGIRCLNNFSVLFSV